MSVHHDLIKLLLMTEKRFPNMPQIIDLLVLGIWRRGKPDALLNHSNHGSR